ncbi:hypothetical protein GOP47_0014918 [Adiantum capillus-veneris]|uniref:Bulb-type lectin domain-containing protein n=1 Tax=Adiantum capillus-veneris TaxID=13818 RepID=A0A9D4UMD6_ADICA|nr:hypothetical protein GOP47_0014918 [Adiantum capillus-veneris]
MSKAVAWLAILTLLHLAVVVVSLEVPPKRVNVGLHPEVSDWPPAAPAPPTPPVLTVADPDSESVERAAVDMPSFTDSLIDGLNMQLSTLFPLIIDDAVGTWHGRFGFTILDRLYVTRTFEVDFRIISWPCLNKANNPGSSSSGAYGLYSTLRWILQSAIQRFAIQGKRFVTSAVENLAMDYIIEQTWRWPPQSPPPPPSQRDLPEVAQTVGFSKPRPLYFDDLVMDVCNPKARYLFNSKTRWFNTLYPGEALQDKYGRYELFMLTTDCKLELRDLQNNSLIWSSSTWNINNAKFCKASITMEGNFVIQDVKKNIVWQTHTSQANQGELTTFTLGVVSSGVIVLENQMLQSVLWRS